MIIMYVNKMSHCDALSRLENLIKTSDVGGLCCGPAPV